MNPVRPFGLQGIQQQMDKGIERQKEEYPSRPDRYDAQGQREKKAENKGSQDDGINPQIERVCPWKNKSNYSLQYPWNIWNYTAEGNPLEVGAPNEQTAGRRLYAEMNKGIGHAIFLSGY